jgi:hypothetical protein
VKHEVCFNEEQDVLYVRFIGELEKQGYYEIVNHVSSLPGEKRSRIIVDISAANAQIWDRKVRQMFAEESRNIPGDRIAIIGASPTLRMMAQMIIASAKKTTTGTEYKFSKTEEEAIVWLKEKK